MTTALAAGAEAGKQGEQTAMTQCTGEAFIEDMTPAERARAEQVQSVLPALREVAADVDARGEFHVPHIKTLSDAGLLGLIVPEEFGGLGYGHTGLGLVLEQAGRHLSASPLESTVLVAATLLLETGSQAQKEQLLPAIAAGETVVTIALQERRHHNPLQVAATAEQQGDDWLISGCKVMVLDAHVADKFIVALFGGYWAKYGK